MTDYSITVSTNKYLSRYNSDYAWLQSFKGDNPQPVEQNKKAL